jgi:hypothetical protein
VDDRENEQIEEGDPRITQDVIEHILSEPPPRLIADINFEETPTGYEVWYSERIATQHPELVDESADWLEDQMGVLNLGQIDHKILIADGVLTDDIRIGLKAWWAERVDDLDLE